MTVPIDRNGSIIVHFVSTFLRFAARKEASLEGDFLGESKAFESRRVSGDLSMPIRCQLPEHRPGASVTLARFN